MLSKIALLLSLMVSSVTLANPHGTIIIPVEDLLFEATDFKDSPRFDLNAALRGAWTPELPSRPRVSRAERRKAERIVLDLAWDHYPDASSIRLWRGNLIIRLEDIS